MERKRITPELEQMIDSEGLATVLTTLAHICWEKAEHVRSNWQDESLAMLWERAGIAIDNITTRASVQRLP